ncbi:hypothetical protein [Methylocapsa acidiphila]|uniref:hypothetical protein n=1 Tax=Methylocapsa acidiphila TaxID=133552 RepID=UPI00041662E5|nr:hypothetical protein [Methylocapsa acidiphila]
MTIIGIVLSVFGLGLFCSLLFTLAVYAPPFFAGLTAGLAAFHSGSCVIDALVVGVLAGAATLAIGRIAFAMVRTPLVGRLDFRAMTARPRNRNATVPATLVLASASRPTGRGSVGRVAVCTDCRVVTSSFRNAKVSFSSHGKPGLLLNRRPPRLLPRMLFGARTTRPLHGLIWPKTGYASIA